MVNKIFSKYIRHMPFHLYRCRSVLLRFMKIANSLLLSIVIFLSKRDLNMDTNFYKGLELDLSKKEGPPEVRGNLVTNDVSNIIEPIHNSVVNTRLFSLNNALCSRNFSLRRNLLSPNIYITIYLHRKNY